METQKKMMLKGEEGKYICPYVEQCHFLNNSETMPELIERTIERYCTNIDGKCSRMWIFETLGASAVPDLMLPNQYDWARQIVEDALDSSQTLPKANTP